MPDSHARLHSPPQAEVGRYVRLSDARECALALAARDLAYLIERDGEEWVLRVDESVSRIAADELRSFEAEQRERSPAPASASVEKLPTGSLFLAAWLLCGAFLCQQLFGPEWTSRGAAVSVAISGGEWWRAVTALTLHADLPHLVANLATGLLFASALIPIYGTGVSWLLIVLSGTLGNLVNAGIYKHAAHASIGASTSVFGALGLLVGNELWKRWMSPETRTARHLMVPIGAGMALLAYLGVGDEHGRVDFMAHGCGFAAGGALGLLTAGLRTKERASPWIQRIAALLAVTSVTVAWVIATRSNG